MKYFLIEIYHNTNLKNYNKIAILYPSNFSHQVSFYEKDD